MRAYRDTRTEMQRQRAYGVAARHPHAAVLALQRLAGNRALRHLLRADLDMRVPQGLSEAADARPRPRSRASRALTPRP